MPTPQLQFLDSLLRGERPDQAALQALLHGRVEEDLHLEFKAAQWLQAIAGKDSKRPNEQVRRYVSGFANAEGGVLVIGVAEPATDNLLRSLDPVTAWTSAEKGEKWLSDCVVALGPFLSPPPRFVCVKVDGGFVAVVAVPRSAALVACEEKGELLHYFRLQ